MTHPVNLRRAGALLATAAVCASGAWAARPDAADALVRQFTCTLRPNTWCMIQENHSYSKVDAGQNDFTTQSTSPGWWCAKIYDGITAAEYGRVCDFARIVSSKTISPPDDQLYAEVANGQNAGSQVVRGYAQTP